MFKLNKTVVRAAKNMLSKHQRWCKDFYFKDNHGERISNMNETPCRMCALGALVFVQNKKSMASCDDILYTPTARKAELQLNDLVKEYTKEKYDSLPEFNDSPTTTHKDIISFFNWLEKRVK